MEGYGQLLLLNSKKSTKDKIKLVCTLSSELIIKLLKVYFVKPTSLVEIKDLVIIMAMRNGRIIGILMLHWQPSKRNTGYIVLAKIM